jgi:UDP:flavonoid glycosyltransferase YjiC (YdhE family)
LEWKAFCEGATVRIVIPTTGSRGDVQPYVALGMALQTRGHTVCLATHADFEPFVRGHGLDFFPVERDARALQGSEVGDRMVHSGGNPFAFLREFARLRLPLMADLMAGCLQAAEEADVLFLTNTEMVVGLSVAEKLSLPVCLTALQPAAPTRHFPNFLLPDAPDWPGPFAVSHWARRFAVSPRMTANRPAPNLPSLKQQTALPDWLPDGGAYNLLSHLVVGEYFWQQLRLAVNQARRDVLHLPPLPFLGPFPKFFWSALCLYGFSALVVPRPSDWSANQHVTGYWFLDDAADWQPPAALVDFLNAGPPPVYVGFGSMHNRDADEITDLVIRALTRAGERGILLTGWDGLRPVRSSEGFFPIESVPHDWLFPRVAAVVHHGGAGTTAAALRAGVPAQVVPFMSDQPFWARRVHLLGVGPPPIPRKQLTVEQLALGIHKAVTDPLIRYRAAVLGQRIRAEKGAERAAEVVDQYLAHPREAFQPHFPIFAARRGDSNLSRARK